MHGFTQFFVVALFVQLAISLWLSARQIRHVVEHRNRVPAAFAGTITVEQHARAADYTRARQQLGIVRAIADAALLLWLTLGGGISVLGRWATEALSPPLARDTLHVLSVAALLMLTQLPFAIYRKFVIEQRYGFNRTSPSLFAIDTAKGIVLGLLVGGCIVVAILAVMRSTGTYWWVVAWAVWVGTALLLTLVWPCFVAPLFNRFTALDDPTLNEDIDRLVRECGFSTSGVYVMDGSRRSAHGNAYFTGLGREKRIVFFDTLLGTLSPRQILAVLAHELAHFRLRHVTQRLIVMAGATFAGFAVLGWLAGNAPLYTALGVDVPTDAATLLLFSLVTPVFTWWMAPITAAWSRRHEFQADEFAATHADGVDLASALVRLYGDNASTLTPDPLYSRFHDSHPPPAERVERLLNCAPAVGHAQPAP